MNSDAFKTRYAGFMDDFNANSPMQQFWRTWADLKNVLIDLGNIVMPPLLVALRAFDVVLKGIDTLIRKMPWVWEHFNPYGGGASSGDRENHGTGPSLAPLIQKESYTPGGKYNSGGNMDPIHIRTAVYLDGRIIAETVSTELARLSTFPGQAAYGDPYGGWMSPDHNTAAI